MLLVLGSGVFLCGAYFEENNLECLYMTCEGCYPDGWRLEDQMDFRGSQESPYCQFWREREAESLDNLTATQCVRTGRFRRSILPLQDQI